MPRCLQEAFLEFQTVMIDTAVGGEGHYFEEVLSQMRSQFPFTNRSFAVLSIPKGVPTSQPLSDKSN